MLDQDREVLDALKSELNFVEKGGYSRSVREPRKKVSILRDSLSCPNNGSDAKTVPCKQCYLMKFVSAGKAGEAIPCHHIPLNDRGDTVDTIAASGEDFQVQDAMVGWLHGKISELESADAKRENRNQLPV